MLTPSAIANIRALRELGFGLHDTYPYASMLGNYLKADEPSWFLRFETSRPDEASLPLEQARDYAFLRFCEHEQDILVELDDRVGQYIADGARHLQDELLNTAMWYRKLAGQSIWK